MCWKISTKKQRRDPFQYRWLHWSSSAPTVPTPPHPNKPRNRLLVLPPGGFSTRPPENREFPSLSFSHLFWIPGAPRGPTLFPDYVAIRPLSDTESASHALLSGPLDTWTHLHAWLYRPPSSSMLYFQGLFCHPSIFIYH